MIRLVQVTEAERAALLALVARVGVGAVVQELRLQQADEADKARGTMSEAGLRNNVRLISDAEFKLVYAWVEATFDYVVYDRDTDAVVGRVNDHTDYDGAIGDWAYQQALTRAEATAMYRLEEVEHVKREGE